MAKKNNVIAAGLDGLLKPAEPVEVANAPEPEAEQGREPKGNYKTVCYSIPPELADRIRNIAYWDRKKINAVVAEAFAAYCDSWTPSNTKTPKKL